MNAIKTAQTVVETALQDPKAAASVGGATTGGGLGVIFDILPSGAELAALCGALLSLVLAWNHWKKGKLERQKLRLENDLLKRELAKHVEP